MKQQLSNQARVLGFKIDTLDHDEALRSAHATLLAHEFCHVVTLNPLMMLEALHTRELREACENASLVISDSAGLTWSSKFLKQPKLPRLPGIDFAEGLCQWAGTAGKSIYLLGGASGRAEQAARALLIKYPALKIAGTRDGFYKVEQETGICEEIRLSAPSVVLVALGTPKQELFIFKNKKHLPKAIFIGVGGAFDVWSGHLKRAPILFQRLGLEWLFRLGQEPSRWKRMLRLPWFVILVIQQRIFRKTL